MSKFENRTTKAVAAIIDFEKQSMRVEECEIPYTRTVAKAVKSVAKALSVPENCVAIRELVQNEFKANDISAGDIINASHTYGLLNAPETVEENDTVIKYTAYIYYGTVFGYENDGEKTPIAKRITFETTEKYGKNTARGALHHTAETELNMNVYALDYEQRKELTLYAVMNKDAYDKLKYA